MISLAIYNHIKNDKDDNARAKTNSIIYYMNASIND